jgi:erythromycin esterase
VVAWIDRHAVPLSGTHPHQPAGELSHLRGVVRGAAIVGLGESAHGTHTQLRLKHRVARYLVENLGFRTIAWEEGWGSGVTIDRYVTSGRGDPTAIVGDALFMLRTEAMLELVGWMREFNRGRHLSPLSSPWMLGRRLGGVGVRGVGRRLALGSE